MLACYHINDSLRKKLYGKDICAKLNNFSYVISFDITYSELFNLVLIAKTKVYQFELLIAIYNYRILTYTL